MRKPFLITLIITFIGAISWGMYVSKTNPLDYLFEIGIVLMGLGISILWQMKLFFLKPEHKKSFSSWCKKSDKKFVMLFMRDEQRMLPFIVPLAYLARALVFFGVGVALGDWPHKNIANSVLSNELRSTGIFMFITGFIVAYLRMRGIWARSKDFSSSIEAWKKNPTFTSLDNSTSRFELEKAGVFTAYTIDHISITVMQCGIVCILLSFLFNLIAL